MAGWREQKREARKIVHETMALPCWHIPHIGGVQPVLTRARLHTARPTATTSAMGDIESLGYGKWEADHTKLVFMREEVDPKRYDVFIFAPDEAYTVEPERPFDDITVTVKVSRMEVKSAIALVASINPPLEFFPT